MGMPESGANKQSEVTRDNLYQSVWSTPMSKLGRDFGTSYAELIKTCNRLGVPRPTRGYWVKLRFGKKMKKTPLPPLKEGEPSSTTIAQNLVTRAGMGTDTTQASELPLQGSAARADHP